MRGGGERGVAREERSGIERVENAGKNEELKVSRLSLRVSGGCCIEDIDARVREGESICVCPKRRRYGAERKKRGRGRPEIGAFPFEYAKAVT